MNNNLPDWLEEQFDDALNTMSPADLSATENRISKFDNQSRYTEKLHITQGGMKTISKVYDELTGRTVAMAELRDPYDQIARELFLREAHLNSILQHPNIVQIYDFGYNSARNPYFTMKLLRGKTLKEFLLSCNWKTDRNILLTKFIAVCEAVAFAHSCGIMHLDLKPENIWIGDFDETLVMDWGLARVCESACDERLLDSEMTEISGATLYGMVRGTPGYMSPEQLNKKLTVSHKSDIFSLGVILYKILTGKAAFEGDSNSEIIKNTKAGLFLSPADQGLPESLSAIIGKAMESAPSKRYNTAVEMADDIRFYLNGFATSAENAGFFKQLTLLYLRNKKTFNIICASIVIISMLINISLGIIRKHTEQIGIEKLRTQTITERLNEELKSKERLTQIAVKDFFGKGKRAYERGAFSQSLKLFEEAFQLGGNSPELHHYLSGLYIYAGKLDFTLTHLKLAQEVCKKGSFIDNETATAIKLFNRVFQDREYTLENLMSFNYGLRRNNLRFYFRHTEKYLFQYPMSLDKRIKFAAELIRIVNGDKKSLKVQIKKLNEGVKVDLSGNGKVLKWGACLEHLPIVELDVSNTAYKLIDKKRFPMLKVLNIKNTGIKKLALFDKAEIEELHISGNFKENFKDLVNEPHLKKIYIPKSFKSQKRVINNLRERKIKIVYE